MKLLQILLQHRRRISRRIASDHHRQQYRPDLSNDLVVHEAHLVKFVRADVGAVCEAKVHQRVLSEHVVGREDFAVLVDKCEGATDFGFPNSFGLVSYALARDALFLVCEVSPETGTGCDEEDGGGEVEGLDEHLLSALFHSLPKK